jgi:hypothetical protein
MPLTDAQIVNLLQRNSGDPILYLVTITHPQLDTIRLVRDVKGKNCISRGTEFTAAYVFSQLATDSEDLPVMAISIPNVDRSIGNALSFIRGGPPKVTIECAFASDCDTPFRRYAHFEMTNVRYDPMILTADCRQMRLDAEPFPSRRVIPSNFFGIYRQ